MKLMLAPELAKTHVFMEFQNSHGNVRRPRSPILVEKTSMITVEFIKKHLRSHL